MLCETTYGDRNDVEDFVRAGSDCPALSLGLRERIIASAVTAQASDVRQMRRGRAGVVLGLSLALAMFVGRQPLLSAAHWDVVLSPLALEKLEVPWDDEEALVDSSATYAPDRLSWRQVESLSRLRRWHMDTLRAAFVS